jgi:hypothetical protein
MQLIFLRLEAPVKKVAGVKSDTQKICGNEAELRGAETDDADDGTIDGGDDPALPQFPANEDGAQDG